ncbi:hypothetical protein BT96DRAFT_846376 [Gymnopus androsaceus JB14]|uniref:Uncharacterized protein n=1 Tax=Gymnopus androsaceus JB14 TaxID=1447944 RepID=A0A6A4IRC7_9AGAR|nr:hypothetical protein BT96DRAFT_846376 [Gymnopus androsaceus JB14]
MLIKFGGDFAEEVRATLYAQKQFSFPVTRILSRFTPPEDRNELESLSVRPRRVWYICMQQSPGALLDKVIDAMTPDQLAYIYPQIRHSLDEMSSIRPNNLSSIT